ncbi:disulfide bond formation protein B [Kangiella sp. HZ709]|uniref:disulfide bond formation protein B n=1 Tax=Kangiella sp. HZ709 TaxID=2666328 RepID=UPI0012B002C9|nr:disulfide bond formation protein B [Kangiella sp. HZ709]MRX28209.1 disulfide bond formation protein B [Kangiella sp. HZ709]
MTLNTRALNFLGAFICYQLIVTAYYFQYVQFMDPCPLCIFSRVAIFSLGVVLLLNAIFQPRHESLWNKLLQLLGIAAAFMGIWISAKHVYIQNLPADQVMDCGAPLDLLMDVMPMSEVISTVLIGDGKCAEINFQWLGLTMPGWMLVIFSIAFLTMLYRFVQCFKAPKSI